MAYPSYQGTYSSMMHDSVKVFEMLRNSDGCVRKEDIMEALLGVESTPMQVPRGHRVKFIFPVDVRSCPLSSRALLCP